MNKMELCCTIADEILQMLKDRGIIKFEILNIDMFATEFTEEEEQDLFDAIYDILDNYLEE